MAVEIGSRREAKKLVAAAVTLGVAGGGADVLGITIENHRRRTHRSLEPHPLVSRLIEASQRSLGVKGLNVWADVHIDHHAFADVDLFPFLRVSRAVNWLEREHVAGRMIDIKIPEYFKHLDPMIDEGMYHQGKVREIGDLAEAHVRERMSHLYNQPEEYTEEQLYQIFYPEKFDFYYPKYTKKKSRDDYTSDDLARILLSDPHSPVYADRKRRNGVKEIFLKGIWPYKIHADARNFYPEIMMPDLQPKEDESEKNVALAVATGFLLPSAAFLVARGKYRPKDFAIAAALGSLANSTRAVTELSGAMIVNSLGHAGSDLNTRNILKAVFSSKYDIKLNPDGTVAADTTLAGPLGIFASWFSADEVGKQEFHHDEPDKVKYTDKTGIKGVLDAPWGSLLDTIVKSRWTLLEPGDNFGLPEGVRRPDEPHPATLLIQKERSKQYLRDHTMVIYEAPPKVAA